MSKLLGAREILTANIFKQLCLIKGGVHIRLRGGFLTVNPLPDGLESWFFGYKGVFGASLSLQDFKAQLCFPGGLPDFFLDSVPVAPNSVPMAPNILSLQIIICVILGATGTEYCDT